MTSVEHSIAISSRVPCHRAPRRGVVLIAVLVVTAMAAMIAAGLVYRMRAELSATVASDRGEQAYQAAMGGIQVAMSAVVAAPDDPTAWYENPTLFRDHWVCDDGVNQWYFTVIAPRDRAGDSAAPGAASGADPSSPEYIRFGVTDESGLIHINRADEETLAKLPGMTPELVDALLDFIDADNDARPNGAEQDYYDNLDTPHIIANGPLATIDQLLLVRGFNAAILYGEDANQNGRLDPNEDDGDGSFPPDNGDGSLDRGIAPLITTFSKPTTGAGAALIDLNGPIANLDALKLSDQTLRFIRLYRADGQAFTHPSQLLQMSYTLAKDHPDIGGARAGDKIDSGVGGDQLAIIMERTTARGAASQPAASEATISADGSALPGVPLESTADVGATTPTSPKRSTVGPALVNVNAAPAAVLACLPGFDVDAAQRAADARGNVDATARRNTAWLFTGGVLDADRFKQAAPYLATQGRQFRVRSIGYGWPCGRFRALEAVVDASPTPPRIVYLRDVTRQGLPLALKPAEEESSRR